MVKKGFSSLIIIFLGLALIGIIGVGGYYFSKPRVTPDKVKNSPGLPQLVQSVTQPSETTSIWKTYSNEEIGFSIKYPDNWVSVKPKGKIPYPGYGKPEGMFTVGFGDPGIKNEDNTEPEVFMLVELNSQITKTPVDDLTKILYLKETSGFVSSLPERDSNWLTRTVDGVTAKFTVHKMCQSGFCHIVVFQKGNRIFALEMNQGNQDEIDIFDKMIDSFKFLPQDSVAANGKQVFADQIAGWKTYSNPDYGFSLKYPDNFSYNKQTLPADDIFLFNISFNPGKKTSEFDYNNGFTVEVRTPKTMQEEVDYRKWRVIGHLADKISKETSITVNGFQGVRLEYSIASLDPAAKKDFAVVIVKTDKYMYTIESNNVLIDQILANFSIFNLRQ